MTGIELKEFRVALDLNQAQFGEELGLKNPQIQISQFERGGRIITLRMVKFIEKWKENVRLKSELASLRPE